MDIEFAKGNFFCPWRARLGEHRIGIGEQASKEIVLQVFACQWLCVVASDRERPAALIAGPAIEKNKKRLLISPEFEKIEVDRSLTEFGDWTLYARQPSSVLNSWRTSRGTSSSGLKAIERERNSEGSRVRQADRQASITQ